MYFQLGICLIFTCLFILNATITITTTALWGVVSNRIRENSTARFRSNFIFVLRVFPGAFALVFAFAFLLPAYLLFEPVSTKETTGFTLAVLSAISAVGILTAFYRFIRTRRATRGLVADWMNHAEPIEIAHVSIPAYRISHQFPVVAIVGIFRPQIFIARQVFDSLSKEEFQAVIAHEAGHIHARDNFKRTLLRVYRDLLVFPFGHRLDCEWAANIETAADEYVVQTKGSRAAVELASALVKIARIVPSGAKLVMPAGAYLIEASTAEVSFRVKKLLQYTKHDDNSSLAKSITGKISLWLYLGLCASIILLLVGDREVLRTIHYALEFIVAFQH